MNFDWYQSLARFIFSCLKGPWFESKTRYLDLAKSNFNQFYFHCEWTCSVGAAAVWPGDEIKSSPMFPKSCPNSRHCRHHLNCDVFKIGGNVTKHFSDLCKKICQQNQGTLTIGQYLHFKYIGFDHWRKYFAICM